jgi:hypothetical protein
MSFGKFWVESGGGILENLHPSTDLRTLSLSIGVVYHFGVSR